MATIQAIPTRFKGVEYRSRSEARFAAFLFFSHWHFSYEPEFLRTENLYVPDFVAAAASDHKHGNPLLLRVIEYKPTFPNEQYVKAMENHFREIAKKIESFGIEYMFFLVTGTVFEDSDRKIQVYNRRSFHEDFGENRQRYNGWKALDNSPTRDSVHWARTYRYDLED